MHTDLSQMTLEERIQWHTKRIEVEELEIKVKYRLFSHAPTLKIKQELIGIRVEIERLENVLLLTENKDFLENVAALRSCAFHLSNLQKDRVRLLRERFSGKSAIVAYEEVKNAFSFGVIDAVYKAVKLTEIGDIYNIKVTKYVSAMYVFDGFKTKYDDLMISSRSKHRVD